MADKREKWAAWLAPHLGKELDAHYLAFFDCFNRGHFYEAHEVLEALWLRERGAPNDRFFKGLIQIAGGFVHLQKGRDQPGTRLLRLALAHLKPYPTVHLGLDLRAVRVKVERWLAALENGGAISAPRLSLEPRQDASDLEQKDPGKLGPAET